MQGEALTTNHTKLWLRDHYLACRHSWIKVFFFSGKKRNSWLQFKIQSIISNFSVPRLCRQLCLNPAQNQHVEILFGSIPVYPTTCWRIAEKSVSTLFCLFLHTRFAAKFHAGLTPLWELEQSYQREPHETFKSHLLVRPLLGNTSVSMIHCSAWLESKISPLPSSV